MFKVILLSGMDCKIDLANPWSVQSIFDLQYFNCPSCSFKHDSKQTFVDHAYAKHFESADYLAEISDGSLDDIICPWKLTIDIKEENVEEQDPFTETSIKDSLPNKETMPDLEKANHSQQNVIHQCKLCNEVFSNYHKLEEHRENIHSILPKRDKDTRCNDCLMPYSSFETLELHDVKCQTLQQKICDSCDQQFSDLAKLKQHRKKVHKKRYECDICQRQFITEQRVLLHKKKEHEKNKDKVDSEDYGTCHLCGKTMLTTSIQKHIRYVHKKVRNYTCDICGFNLRSPSQLKQHKKCVHDGIREHQCDICGKGFSEKKYLKTHEKSVHKKLRDIQCPHPQCNKSFSRKDVLRIHIEAAHAIEKQFVCDLCDKKSFCNRAALRTHIQNIHEGVRNFQCNECGKKFFLSANYKAHVKAVHQGIKDHKCENCGAAFFRNDALVKHSNSCHKS